jgi:hypothetical protein
MKQSEIFWADLLLLKQASFWQLVQDDDHLQDLYGLFCENNFFEVTIENFLSKQQCEIQTCSGAHPIC